MARRKKSIKDIRQQYERIANLAYELASRDGANAAAGIQNVDDYVAAYNAAGVRANDREEAAFRTAQRYINNIRKQKSTKNIRAKVNSAAANGNDEEYDRLKGMASNRKFARSTYMGNSKG